MTLELTPLSPAIGVEISGLDLREEPDEDTFGRIIAAWHDHLLLLFRGQDLDEAAQARFCHRFGAFVPRVARQQAPVPGLSGDSPHTMLVSNIRKDGKPIGTLRDGELIFHSDGAFQDIPCKASMLFAIEVPAAGGETVFADMYKVHDALDDATRAKLAGCTAENYFHYHEKDGMAPGRLDMYDRDAPHATHPVITSHPVTGRKVLFVNRLMTKRIVELPPDDSAGVLNKLFRMIEQPRFTYVHRWAPGDFLIWDNRCTQHGRRDFDPKSRRLLRRFAVQAEAPPRAETPPDQRVAI